MLVKTSSLGWWAVAVFFGGILGATAVGVGVVAVGADGFEPISFALVFVGQAGASLFLVFVFSKRLGSGSLAADVGLVARGSDWWALLAGMGLQIGVAIVTYPLLQLMFPDGPPEQGVAGIAGDSETTLEIILILVSAAVLAPLIEEIIFRGMFLPWAHRFVAKWPAILISAAVFSIIHPILDWDARGAAPGIFLLGVVLGWAAFRRGDLSLAIPLHSGVNLLAGILILWGDDILDWAERQSEGLDQAEALLNGVIAVAHALGL
ncbi:MAG: type II CAAX endopeptidase family protein [Actinomycetota bacterium]|nr:type II CAAX endopeptidase family protein [Actinomycetota bacterium]